MENPVLSLSKDGRMLQAVVRQAHHEVGAGVHGRKLAAHSILVLSPPKDSACFKPCFDRALVLRPSTDPPARPRRCGLPRTAPGPC